jgi:spore coat polysaccharide biosynthesis protein SpsF
MSAPIIVQARCGSSRYPRKVLKNFTGGCSLLEFQLTRLKKAFPSIPLVVATSVSGEDNAIEDISDKLNILCFRGSENDVLERFLDCCRHHKFTDYVVRVCGDNPFLQTEWLKALMTTPTEDLPAPDYISYSINGKPAILTHFGFFAEMIRVDALEKIAQMTTMPLYREHVTNYIYQHHGNGDFHISWHPMDGLGAYADAIRLTIDTQEDFDNVQTIYRHLKPAHVETDVPWEDIISFLDKNPTIQSSMKNQIQFHQK